MTAPASHPQTRLTLNARFTTRSPSGVDRVAAELTRALKDVAGDILFDGLGPREDVVVHLPIGIGRGRLSGQIWEQVELPLRLASGTWLLSPCNVGPVLVSKQVLMIHDAQTFIEPQSYSLAFRTWYRTLLPLLARRAQIVLTVSEFSKTQLEKYGVVPSGKARVIPNGGDHILSFEPQLEILERQRLVSGGYLLAIGSLSPHKNLAMLMRAAAARPEGHVPLVIAGGGNSRVFADAGLNPPPGVIMTGRVTDGELRALYENAAAFCFPSLTEGFGLPPIEAMLCGCPTIVSDAGAIPEVCGDASVYVSPTDEAGWTEAMIAIVGSPERRQALVKAGHQRASRFTWARAARMVMDVLDRHGSAGGGTA